MVTSVPKEHNQDKGDKRAETAAVSHGLAAGATVPALAAAMAANTGLVTDRVFRGVAAANGKPAMPPVRRLLPLYKPTAKSGVTEE